MFKRHLKVSAWLGFLVLLWFLSVSMLVHADSREAVDEILAAKEVPAGVVFEVVSADEAYLKGALENFETYRGQLRERFPEIQLAIVTHGREQFALTHDNQPVYHQTHGLVKRIVADDVPVHVCGNHANWRGVRQEDFPDYVDVSVSAGTELKAYQANGYVLVVL